MKYILTLVALCCTLLSYAQKYEYKGINNFPLNTETGRVTYDSVVVAEDRTAHQLYSAAKEWIARNSNARYAIEADIPGEKIIGKGNLIQSNFKEHSYTYDFILSFKDGRYKYELTNFQLNYDYGTPGTRGSYALERYPKENLSGKRAEKLDLIYKGLANDIEQVANTFSRLEEKAKKDDW